MFRRTRQPLRYYLYVSDNKLDMLYEQIDPALRKRISAEVKVDVKVASVTLRQAEQPAAVRMTKLRVIERYIDTHCQVGDVSAPGREFFRGRLEMQWGWLTPAERPDRPSPVVVFRGLADSDFVVLGGSRGHVLGQHAGDDSVALLGYSVLPSLVETLGPHISQMEPPTRYNYRDGEVRGWRETGDEYMEYALHAASRVELSGPRQPLEFLAVPLGEAQVELWDDTVVHGVLGTPIYVAHG
ncbi:DUF7019 family protein [Streptomyces sp. NPDC005784]|uniref:DUF7019 family protein n=1 Tax=Streptomyces sp. NPDC005784 TaxID=3364731 RepID=UPI003681C1D2